MKGFSNCTFCFPIPILPCLFIMRGIEALGELKHKFCLKFGHIDALSQQKWANGNILSEGGWGEGVYRESSCYFQTFHSTNINSEVGPKDPKLYFCNYFGAVFSFNVDGRTEQAASPLSSLGRLGGSAGDGEEGEGTKRSSFGQCWHRLASVSGGGGTCQVSLVCYVEGLTWGRHG